MPTPDPELASPWRLYPFSTTGIPITSTSPTSPLTLFLTRPLYAPLLFPNTSSDARDHCANERNFLSWLRLSIYLAVVSVAILINFHLKHQPTDVERHLSRPLGIIFAFLSGACLVTGVGIYMRTVTKYAHHRAMVQSGTKTKVVFGIVAVAIVAACGVFLGADVQGRGSEVRG